MDPSSSHHQKDFLNSINNQDTQISSGFFPSSSSSSNANPSSPNVNNSSGPQSPGTQLTMSLLNNFLQMQGLENNIVQQQLAGATSGTPHSPPNSTASSPNPYPSTTLLLEQQIKLSQLQQLQQLQNQIFQQQIALISGQSPSILDGTKQSSRSGAVGEQGMYLPTPGPSGEIRPQQPMDFVSPSALANYMEPLPHALVPPPSSTASSRNQISSQQGHDTHTPSLDHSNQHHQHSSSASHGGQSSGSGSMNLNLQRQLHALSQSHNQHPQQPHSPYLHSSSSSGAFQQQNPHQATSSLVYHPTSPMHHPVSPMDQSPNPFGQQHQHQTFSQHSAHSSQHHGRLHGLSMTPHSAPERIAFNIYTGAIPGGGTIPGLTLGPAGTPVGMDGGRRASISGESQRGQNQHQMQMQILDQDISPLTSPWLGAHPTSSNSNSAGGSSLRRAHKSSNSVSGQGQSNKRTASSSGDEGGSARKKQSPAIRPTLGMSVARLVGERERERESGSTSPMTLGVSEGSGRKGKHTPPPLGADKMDTRNTRSSSSSRSASGSPSPDPSRLGAGGSNMASGSTSAATTVDDERSRRGSIGAGASTSYRPYRGSKSTNSTPLLRSTPTSAMAIGLGMTASRTQSKSRPAPGSGSGSMTQTPGMEGEMAGVHDSPSPVDLNPDADGVDRSMPPPPLPSSVSSSSSANASSNGRQEDGGNGENGGGMNMPIDVDMNGMGMNSMMNMGGMGSMNNMGGMGFGGIMSGLNGMGGMNDSMGMDMSMGMGMNGMNMDMDIGIGGMNMDGMGMGGFAGNMGGMGMMDMSGMDFGHGQGSHQQQQHQDPHEHRDMTLPPQNSLNQQPMVPVTPASIMNLTRLGITNTPGGSGRLGSATAAATTSSANASASNALTNAVPSTKKGNRKDSASTRGAAGGTTTRRTSTRKLAANVVSPSLKPLLPAGSMTPNMDPTLPSPMTSASTPNTPHALPTLAGVSGSLVAPAGPVMHVRKTSHKAAEQKRRDSLKTTFDDLRKLLPPIALANDPDVDPNLITSPLFHPTTPLLPGALPPRGPPKAGGEGPNKGVSKLQLLICGNEYIRLLTKRVDRRDDEIEKLRKEVGRLRMVVEERGGDELVEGVEKLDLEKDLDAIERINMGLATHSTDAGSSGTKNNDGGDDAMDEGDDEGDD